MSDTDFASADGTSSDDGSDDSAEFVSVEDMNDFLGAFNAPLIALGSASDDASGSETSDGASLQESDDTEEFDVAPPPPPSPETLSSIARADAAFAIGDWSALDTEYRSDAATPEARAAMVTKMLTSDNYHGRLRAQPMLTAHMLASATVDDLDACPYLDKLTHGKIEVFSSALDFMVRPSILMRGDKHGFPQVERDPAVFAAIAAKLPNKYWNDTQRGMGEPERGLGPRMCAGLWNTGGYDEICGLIAKGVDTKRAALAQGGDMGTYSGFVMPLQHMIQEHLRDIADLGTPQAATWDAKKRAKVEGAQKIFAALDAAEAAETVTSWDDVVNSDLITAFEDEPGTIWGFERVRGPYVEAAHDTDEGTQPVRMMEIWEAVAPVLEPDDYAELLDNTDQKIRDVIAAAVAQIDRDFDTKDKYAHARDATGQKKADYIEAFKDAARQFLETFAQQIPEGAVSRAALTEKGVTAPGGGALNLTELMGISSGKMMGAIACKAGLWAARDEGKPVYYVMDGINMDDVVNYKAVKNQSIAEFLANGGATQSEDTFEEVITMQEVREILTHWEALGDVVKICVKGRVLQGKALAKYIAGHQQAMKAADASTGRAAAAPLETFKAELKAIDSKIFARLEKAIKTGADPAVVAMDARDIVLKSNYVLRIASAKPSLVLKYLLQKCAVLFQYELLSPQLAGAAAGLVALRMADIDAPSKQQIDPIVKTLTTEIANCAKKFRLPLTQALLQHPLLP